PEQIAALIADRHIKGGVQIICGVRVTEIQHNEGQTVVQSEGGGAFAADLVIAGIGNSKQRSRGGCRPKNRQRHCRQ
ncbi:MAG: hypothetical protein EOS61_32340, partial [Mesorhizobium sp.]